MDELDIKKKILLQNKSHILRMPNNRKKAEMLRAYFSLRDYQEFITGVDDYDLDETNIDDEFTDKYDKYVLRDTQKKITELEINAPKLYDKYQEILDAYKDNEFCKYAYIKINKVNKSQMEKAIALFFQALGEDVFKIYCDMVKGKNIYLNDMLMERFGYAMDATPIDNACITIQNIPYCLDFYTTLAHEVGHCYQFYLQKNQRTFASFDPYCEITSMLFEALFIEYLKTNHLIKDDSLINLERHLILLNNVSISRLICKLFREKKIGTIQTFNLSYTCSVSEEELRKEIIDSCGYAPPGYIEPDITEIHYSFGGIITNYFLRRLMNDFDNEWINFKNFICTVNYLPMSEVIDTYFEINPIKEDIKKLTKSYH